MPQFKSKEEYDLWKAEKFREIKEKEKEDKNNSPLSNRKDQPSAIERTKGPIEHEALVNSVINIMVLLLIISAGLSLFYKFIALPDTLHARVTFLQYTKYLYDWIMEGTLFVACFGLYRRREWARKALIIILSLSLVEGVYFLVKSYWLLSVAEKNLSMDLSDRKFYLLKMTIPCLLYAFFIYFLSRRSVKSIFQGDGQPNQGYGFRNTIDYFKKAGIQGYGFCFRFFSGLIRLIMNTPRRKLLKYGLICAGVMLCAGAINWTLNREEIPVMIAPGGSHALALSSKGNVWAWGDNSYGQLGNGNSRNQRGAPIPVKGISDVVAVSAGEKFSVALTKDGKVYTWGENSQGQLGDDLPYVIRTRPDCLESISEIKAVSAGLNHILVLKNDRTVWAWGDNISGQLGDGTTTDRSSPVQVRDLSDVVAVSSGQFHSLALKSDGTVWAWGSNAQGQLGDESKLQKSLPLQIEGLMDVVAISAGRSFNAALKNDGTVWIWGQGLDRESPDLPGNIMTKLRRLSSLSKIVFIAVGDNNLLAVNKKGDVFLWNIGGKTQPVKLKGVDQVACGHSSYFAIKGKAIWAWGSNTNGLLGIGKEIGQGKTDPVRVSLRAIKPDPTEVLKPKHLASVIAAGYSHTLVLKSDGSLWAWGNNEYQQIGPREKPKVHLPVRVQDVTDIVAISAGHHHTLALKRDGTVLEWGRTLEDRLNEMRNITIQFTTGRGIPYGGRPISERRYTPGIPRTKPMASVDISEICAISAGDDFSLALKKDGTVWAWGLNTVGELGNGSHDSTNTPTQVSDLSDIIKIAAGGVYALALKKDGTVWAWGRLGEVNDLFNTGHFESPVPIQVQGLKQVTAIAAGRIPYALTKQGLVWTCWDKKRLGTVLEPSLVGGIKNVVIDISSNGGHVLALTREGKVLAWGSNQWGELGDGTIISDGPPGYVRDLNDVIAISAGDHHSIALKKGGSLWIWGGNNSRQLGDDIIDSSSYPVPLKGF